jgi:hypothetical protein
LNVYIFIASHAWSPSATAFPSLERISSGTGIDRRHLSALIRQIAAKGLWRVEGGSGRGHALTFWFIDNNAEKSPPTVTFSPDLKVTKSGIEKSPNPDLKVTKSGIEKSPPMVTQLLKEKRTESTTERSSPFGGAARAREEEGLLVDDEVSQQGELLLPIIGGKRNDDGTGDQQAAIANFHPPLETVDWALREYQVDALADDVLGKFRDNLLAYNKRPSDLNAAYKNWIRNEPRFAQSRAPPGSAVQTARNLANMVRAMRGADG